MRLMREVLRSIARWIHLRRCERHLLLDIDARRRIMTPRPKENRLEWAVAVARVVLIVVSQVLAHTRASDCTHVTPDCSEVGRP